MLSKPPIDDGGRMKPIKALRFAACLLLAGCGDAATSDGPIRVEPCYWQTYVGCVRIGEECVCPDGGAKTDAGAKDGGARRDGGADAGATGNGQPPNNGVRMPYVSIGD
jgi:hypothetical protein